MRVLIVEDEPHLAEAIREGPRLEAIAVDIAGLRLDPDAGWRSPLIGHDRSTPG